MNNQNRDNKYTNISEFIFQVQEEERNRIARDLHDFSLQDLTYILHKLELLGLYMDENINKAKEELLVIRKSLKKSINDIRNVIFDLRPTTIDDLGLREALEVFFVWLKENTDFNYVTDIDEINIDNETSLHIYRIVVECVLNAVRYSKGSCINVRCKDMNDEIRIYIEDDGIGFEKNNVINNRVNHGISIVGERVSILNGNITYNTALNQGVKIDICIPV